MIRVFQFYSSKLTTINPVKNCVKFPWPLLKAKNKSDHVSKIEILLQISYARIPKCTNHKNIPTGIGYYGLRSRNSIMAIHAL